MCVLCINFKPSKHPQIRWIPAWTCTLTKIVSNFSPTCFPKSQRSMLKARRILTSTAALKRRLAADEGGRIPPFTFCSYKTEAKDGSFVSSKFPPCGVKLTLTVEYHRYETSTRRNAYSVLKTARCLFFFPSGKKRKQASYEYFSIRSPWETQTARLSATLKCNCLFNKNN